MPRTIPSIDPRRSLAAALLVAAGAPTALAQNAWWTGGVSSTWSNPGNWFGGALPTPADHVRIGWGAYEDKFVQLNMDDAVGSMRIEDLSSFNTAFNTMVVLGDTVVDGSYTVQPGGDDDLDPAYLQIQGAAGEYFMTNNLTLSDGFMNMWHDGHAIINGQLTMNSRSVIRAHGEIEFNSGGTNFRNEGRIVPFSSQSNGPLEFRQNNIGALFDLDGLTGGGRIEMNYYDSSEDQGTDLRFYGAGLSDSFSSSIDMTNDSNLHMNLTNGWVADAGSEINLYSSASGNGEAARIHGSDFEFSGVMSVEGTDARLRVHSDSTTLTPQARVNIGTGDTVQFGDVFSDSVTIEGGTYDVGQGGLLEFWSDIDVEGGAFTTPSPDPADGEVVFRGDSHWSGETTFDGFVRVNELATIEGFTTINAGRLDMDGASDDTVWDVDTRLTVNAGALGASGSDTVHSEINIGNPLGARLVVHIDSDVWTSFGEINLAGTIASLTRIDGDRLRVGGDLNLPSSNATIASDVLIMSSAEVELTTPSATLRLTGDTTALSSASFVGAGTLWNAGEMMLRSGVDLNTLALRNTGDLRLGNDMIEAASIGVVGMDAFENDGAGAYVVSLGGHIPGVGHDLLMVGEGGTTLAGDILVEHVDLGDGVFEPEVGDEFLVLTSVATISGAFENDPISFANGLEYHWEVVHYDNAVFLRLDSVVPGPQTVALLGLGLATAAQRRRRAAF